MSISKTYDQNNRNLKFLIIEDDKTVQRSMSLLLPTLFNCEIHAVDTGEEGIKAATDYLFNLILTDIDLPGISGIMVAKQIRRQSRSKNKDTPIIAISGNLGAKREGYKVGINAFLAKPFITSQALKKIIDFLL